MRTDRHRNTSKKIVSLTLLHMDVSKNSGTPKSSISIGFPIINHPFWGTLIFGNTGTYKVWLCYLLCSCGCASTIFTHQIAFSFPTHVSFPLFLIYTCHIFKYLFTLYMVSIFLFSLMNLEKQPAPLTTPHHFCPHVYCLIAYVETGDVTALCSNGELLLSGGIDAKITHYARLRGAREATSAAFPSRFGWQS